MHPDKMKNILAMNANERFGYFIRKCADFEEVWGLRNDEGWCGMGTDNGGESIPFWPEESFAVLMADDEWADCTPESIPLEEFVKEWLPNMDEDGIFAAVFPVPGNPEAPVNCVTLDGLQLRDIFLEECEQYGGLS